MKIALCFFGKTFGHQTAYANPPKQKKIRCLNSLESIRKNVIQDHDVDIYFHAWVDSPLSTEDLCRHLRPKDFKAEEQKIFANGIRQQAYLSHIYTRTESLKLAFNSNIPYDLIVAIRYDVTFFAPVPYERVKSDILYTDGDVYTRDWHIVGYSDTVKKMIPMFDFAKEIVFTRSVLTCTSNVYEPFYQLKKIERQTLLRYNPPKADRPRDTDLCLVRQLRPQEIEAIEKAFHVRTKIQC
jgi:hypothetical protein